MARAGLRSVQGHACYRSFAQAFVLSASVRQSADDAFCDLLVRLRNGESLQDDYQLLCMRFVARVDQWDFVRLFPVKRSVEEHNLLMLCSLGRPIAVIEGVHNNSEARRADYNTAGGLESCVSLAVVARIMLRANLWIGAGLVNGSLRFWTSSICRASRHQLCRILSCAHSRSILGRPSFQHYQTSCRLLLLRVSGIPATALSHGHNFRCVLHTRLPYINVRV